ncbi:hypothetical protein L9F63_014664, partial [Diploptera punctata]
QARENRQRPDENIPPPLPLTEPPPLDPDYEIIEFPGQAYTNAPLPVKTGEGKRGDGRHCDLCGCSTPTVRCDKCAHQIFCLSCDDMYHRHPKRQSHVRKALDTTRFSTFRPPLPPKNEAFLAPVPPPRKNKRPGSSNKHIINKKNFSTLCKPSSSFPDFSRYPGPTTKQGPTLPKKDFTMKDKMGSLKRMMGGRPLPPPPNNKFQTMRGDMERTSISPSMNSDHAHEPKSQLIDRLGTLQQRYRQHQAAMRDQLPPSRDSGYPDWEAEQQWSPRNRSSSISGSSGIEMGSRMRYNSNDISGIATLSRRRASEFQSPPSTPTQRNNGMFGRGLMQSNSMTDIQGMSTFHPQAQTNFPSMHQAQSMAHMNCPSCHHGMVWMPNNPWEFGGPPGRTPSNLSLNMPGPGYTGGMYPTSPPGAYPLGMSASQSNISAPNANLLPPTMDHNHRRASSPAHSTKSTQHQRRRAVSPTLSVKSTQLRRVTSPAPNYKPNQQFHRNESPTTSIKSRRSQVSRSNHNQSQQRSATVSQNKHRETPESSVEEYFSNAQNDDEQDISDADFVKNPEEEAEKEEEELPPPKPIIPTHQWECEHCTYVNRAGTRVCAICCKTPTTIPRKPSSTDTQQSRRRLRRGMSDAGPTTNGFGTQSRSQKTTNSNTTARHSSTKNTSSRSDVDYSDTSMTRHRRHTKFNQQLKISQKPSKVTKDEDPYEGVQLKSSDVESTKSTNTKNKGKRVEGVKTTERGHRKSHHTELSDSLSETKSVPSAPSEQFTTITTTSSDSHSQLSLATPSPLPIFINRESATINSAIKEVPKSSPSPVPKPVQKTTVSTGVGPSPPREIPTQAVENTPVQKTEIISISTAIETQTTTEDSVQENSQSVSKSRMVTSTGTSPPPQSISTQTYEVPQKIMSGRSDTAVSPRPVRRLKRAMSLHMGTQTADDTWSTTPHYVYRSISRQSLMSDSQSLPLSRDGSPVRYGSRFVEDDFVPYADRNNLGSYTGGPSSDLRRDDLPEGKHRSFMDHKRGLKYHVVFKEKPERYSRRHSVDIVQKQRAEAMKSQGLELVRMLREAEQHNFTAEDLQENWRNMIDTVVTLATNYGHERKENNIGTISVSEARDALRMHKGNVWAAVTECVEQRQKKVCINLE